MALREIEIKGLDQGVPTVDLQRAVYVGAALLLATFMLAFATAPLTNGGAGAVYVLLRRVPGFQKK